MGKEQEKKKEPNSFEASVDFLSPNPFPILVENWPRGLSAMCEWNGYQSLGNSKHTYANQLTLEREFASVCCMYLESGTFLKIRMYSIRL
jgi:hypothetical protein